MTCLSQRTALLPVLLASHAATLNRRFEKAERELARAMAIGRSLQIRRETLDGAEQLCAEVVNMIKAIAASATGATAVFR